MDQPSEGLGTFAESQLGEPLAERWLQLSEATSKAFLGPDPTESIDSLKAEYEAEPHSPLAPCLRLWEADALARSGQYRSAASAYEETLAASDVQTVFAEVDVVGEAARHKAAVLAHAGDTSAAIESFRDAANHGDRSLLYKAGVAAERAGQLELAVSLYREVADEDRHSDPTERSQRALRAVERLETDSTVFRPSLMGIVDLVQTAVSNRDVKLIPRLASSTHLLAGPGGGHFRYEDPELVDWLCADLAISRSLTVGKIRGTGRKRYLFTSGWRGRYFQGIVGFVFLHSGRGWEWAGVIVNAPEDVWRSRWAPKEKATNQPLPFSLLAPWPEGRRFTAGGLGRFATRSAAVLAALAIPFVGPAVSAGIALGFSRSNCGYGTRGFYYNEGPTHSGTSAFAIDFTTYRRGVPFDNESGGTPVLCAADGIVRMVDEDVASGDDSDANEVQVDHQDPATGTNRFVSRYMHMTGPFAIPVSAGMWAPPGRRLGLMNDTGTSLLDHLHFSIHDTTTGPGIGNSVRPNPLDGVRLGDDDSGTCVLSSNRETIVVTLPPGCGELLTRLVREAFGGGRG